MVVIRENTEGTYAGEGGFLRKGTPHEVATQGSVNTRHRRRALRPLRLRAGPSAAPQAPHAGAQDQRAHLRRRPLGAHLRRGGRRVPRRRPPPTTTSTPPASTSCRRPQRYDVIVTDNLFGDILTDLGGAVSGGIGFAVERQPQPRPHRPVDVRAGARLGARHRRPEQGQPHRRHPVGRAHARLPRRGRRGRPHPQGLRRGHQRSAAPPPRSATWSPPACKEQPAMPITPTEKIWMNGELVAWDDAQHPHPHPHPPLRHGRVRGHPRLRDRRRPRRLPPHRAHRAAASARPRS